MLKFQQAVNDILIYAAPMPSKPEYALVLQSSVDALRENFLVMPELQESKHIPESLRDGLENYVTHGRPTGDFLKDVLSDNLTCAFGRADARSLFYMNAIVHYCVNWLPGMCWGSPKQVRDWLSGDGLKDYFEQKPEYQKLFSKTTGD